MAELLGTDEVRAWMGRVVASLRRIRMTRVGLLEQELVSQISARLSADGIDHVAEVVLGPRCRIDLAVPTGPDGAVLGIEVKKGRPMLAPASRQVSRYAATGRLAGIVFVAERAFDLPDCLSGIPVATVSLQANLGISL